jgi:uncharacterized protein (TIGR02147 family)
MQQEVYLQILQREFDKKKEKNTRYSLRVFAKHLDIDHSTLSQIFSRKRGLSDKLAKKIAGHMTLTHHDKQKFLISVDTCFARAKKKKAAAAEKMTQITKFNDTVVVLHAPLNTINHWRYIAVYELVSNKRATTISQLVEILKLSIDQTSTIVSHLCELNILSYAEGNLAATASSVQTLNDIPAEAIVKYHASIAEKAAQSVASHPVLEREFQNLVISFAKDQMPGAKQMIRDFMSEFSTKYYNENPTTEVYSLAVNFFSLERH